MKIGDSEVLYDEQLEEAYEIVEEALKRKTACRNSDEFLVWYCKKYLIGEGEDTDLDNYSEFKSSPGMRTLIRKRAEIQNDEGRFPPSDPEVAEERRVKEDVIWQHYSRDAETLRKFLEAGFFKEESNSD